jgi:5-formyltetrahydrofolate cyclo-ligase
LDNVLSLCGECFLVMIMTTSGETPAPPPGPQRQALRERMRSERKLFVSSPQGQQAADALAAHLVDVLTTLVPECLGVYWPLRWEFNAASLCVDAKGRTTWPLALPFAHRDPPAMHYLRWDGAAPTGQDECGIAAAAGERVVPDVVLVPCLGYTAEGFRLGYGGGYFDRYLALHPDVTAIGVAWSVGQLSPDEFKPEAHDQRMTLMVTERGVVEAP